MIDTDQLLQGLAAQAIIAPIASGIAQHVKIGLLALNRTPKVGFVRAIAAISQIVISVSVLLPQMTWPSIVLVTLAGLFAPGLAHDIFTRLKQKSLGAVEVIGGEAPSAEEVNMLHEVGFPFAYCPCGNPATLMDPQTGAAYCSEQCRNRHQAEAEIKGNLSL